MPVEPNTVYLLPPMKEMIIRQRRLLLNDRDPRHGLTLPIDLFFRSLAQDVGERAVAVILSGSGSDGSRGVQEISKAGGMVFCESPDTAQFNGMPLSAMRTGVVDQVLPPEEIARAVAALGQPAPARALPAGRRPTRSAASTRSCGCCATSTRIDFSHYKAEHGHAAHRAPARAQPLARHRHVRRAAAQRSARAELALRGSADRRHAVLPRRRRRSTRSSTGSFRSSSSAPIPDEQIRVWVPGLRDRPGGVLDRDAAARAAAARGAGRSTSRSSRPTCTRRRSKSPAPASTPRSRSPASARSGCERFFTLKPNGYQISQTLRESIVFAPHNLIRDAPFTKLDLITCRNLLIYFQPHAQKTVLTLFHFCAEAGRLPVPRLEREPGRPARRVRHRSTSTRKIYRKRRDIGLPRDLKLPLPRSGTLPRPAPPPAPPRRRRQPAAARRLRPAARSLHAAELPGRRARPAGRHLRRRRVAAQGQGAAAVAEPARHARRRPPHRGRPARCTACAAMPRASAIRRCRSPGDRRASRWCAEPMRDRARRADPRPHLARRRRRPRARRCWCRRSPTSAARRRSREPRSRRDRRSLARADARAARTSCRTRRRTCRRRSRSTRPPTRSCRRPTRS